MSLIGQLVSASFPKVLNERQKPTNVWSESALLRHFEKMGFIKRKSFGPTLEEVLDYRRTPNAGFLATDMQQTSLVKSEVLTRAEYTPGRLSAEMVWSKADEGMNSSDVQKVALVDSIINNALDTHDDLIEQALFASSTDGFLGLQTIVADNGEGTVGGINATNEAWWRNHDDTYAADGSDIEAALTEAYNTTLKGTGSKLGSKLIVSGPAAQAIYEAQLQANVRYIKTEEGDAGFKALAFKDAPWIFSQYGGTRIYGLTPKAISLCISKEMFRSQGDTIEIPNAQAYVKKVFSLLQLVAKDRSRLFVLTQAQG